MQPLGSIAVYLLAIFMGGALIAPWLHGLVQTLAPFLPWLEQWADAPFHRYVNRSIQGCALLALIPFCRHLKVVSWRNLGLEAPRRRMEGLKYGFALGFFSMALIAVPALACQARLFKPDLILAEVLQDILGAALSGLAVGVVEEVLFRGALFGFLRRAHHWVVALLVSSFLYAMMHFFQKPPAPDGITWTSGWITLGQMLEGFTQFETFMPGFLILCVVGMILGMIYHETGNLYVCIGLHASWVFCIKVYATFTMTHKGATQWFWGSRKLSDGWLGFFMLVLFLAGLMIWRQRRPPSPEVAANDDPLMNPADSPVEDGA